MGSTPKPRRFWRLKNLIVLGTIAGLVIGTSVYFVWLRPEPSAAATVPTRQATAAVATFQKSVTATGTLTPAVQEDLSFEAAGTVTAVKVAVGDIVKKGQVLARIDTLQLDAARLQARATLLSARADLADAEEADTGTAGTEAQVSAKKAAVKVAKAAYTTASDAMADATLKASVAGLITAVNIEKGQAISTGTSSGSSSSSSGSSTPGAGSAGGAGAATTASTTASSAAFSIVSTDSWSVTVSVSQTDVANTKKGQQVELTSDDLSAKIFGTVESVGLVPSTTSGTVSYPVVIQITGSPEVLFDGVSVEASIVYERRADVLAIPATAVTTVDGASTVTKVATDGTTSAVTVTTGDVSGAQIEVLTGLAEGDTVSYSPFSGRSGGGGTTTERGGMEGFDPSQIPSGDFPAGGPGGQRGAGGFGPGGATS